MGRDRFDGLRCGVPGCRTVIHAMTGLQELEKLQRHLWRVHRLHVDLGGAMEWRDKFEAIPEKAGT